jgi:hypothetical protein
LFKMATVPEQCRIGFFGSDAAIRTGRACSSINQIPDFYDLI